MKSLKEFLAATPDAKAEYDAAIKAAADTARTEGEATGKTAGMEQMKTAFTAAQPILSSADYPDTVKERVAEKAMAGDNEGLKDFVAMHDMNVEKGKEVKTQEEKDAETAAQAGHNQDLSEDGMVSTPEQLKAAAAKHKEEFGTGGTA